MDEILKYENRQNLYKFLLENYQIKVREEEYYPDMFGNFEVYLEGDFFSLLYYNDRDVLSIKIDRKNGLGDWYALSFIKDLIYTPDAINANKAVKDNASRINELNDFLRKDFDKICELFTEANYPSTKKRLDEGLRKQFLLRHPSSNV